MLTVRYCMWEIVFLNHLFGVFRCKGYRPARLVNMILMPPLNDNSSLLQLGSYFHSFAHHSFQCSLPSSFLRFGNTATFTTITKKKSDGAGNTVRQVSNKL